MNKKYIFLILLTLGLFLGMFHEYYDHVNAYDKQDLVEARVIDINCGNRSNIKIKHSDGIDYVRLKRKECKRISINERVLLIKGLSGKVYWNYKPSKRFFSLVPIYILGFVILFYLDIKSKKRHKAVKRKVS